MYWWCLDQLIYSLASLAECFSRAATVLKPLIDHALEGFLHMAALEGIKQSFEFFLLGIPMRGTKPFKDQMKQLHRVREVPDDSPR